MKNSSDISLAGRVINELEQLGSWCGETHIQKCCYLAKTILNVPFRSEFVLYKHGPYSFDLNSVLSLMLGQNIVAAVPQGRYGSSYHLNKNIWAIISKASDATFKQYEDQIAFICQRVGKRSVVDLEKISTAVYVHLNFESLDAASQPRKLVELKPHIMIAEANLAFQEAQEIFSEAKFGSSIHF